MAFESLLFTVGIGFVVTAAVLRRLRRPKRSTQEPPSARSETSGSR
jgi:hypothetical protein